MKIQNVFRIEATETAKSFFEDFVSESLTSWEYNHDQTIIIVWSNSALEIFELGKSYEYFKQTITNN